MIRNLQALHITLDEQLKQKDGNAFRVVSGPREVSFRAEAIEEASSEEDECSASDEERRGSLPRHETVKESGPTRRRVLFDDSPNEQDSASEEDMMSQNLTEESDRRDAEIETGVTYLQSILYCEWMSDDPQVVNGRRQFKKGRLKDSETCLTRSRISFTRARRRCFQHLISYCMRPLVWTFGLTLFGSRALLLDAERTSDSSRTNYTSALLARWREPVQDTAFRNRFTNGDWKEGKKRSEAHPDGAFASVQAAYVN